MKKHYRLLKDLPTFKAGDTFTLEEDGCLYLDDNGESRHWSNHVMAYHRNTLERFTNILEDWFEEIDADALALERYEQRLKKIERRLKDIELRLEFRDAHDVRLFKLLHQP